jgi:hypothetical protein
VVQVNWKAAATVVTGATALAGWLSTPSASHTTPPRAAAARTRAADATAASHAANIEEQSLRLAARLRPAGSFTVPQRDPFHFVVSRPAPARATASGRRSATAVVPAAMAVEPPPFPYRLSGVATDSVEGQPVRTAVLAGGDTGLVLVKAGDMVEGVYRVDTVDENAVQITDTRDGRTVRVTFTTP